MAEMFGGEIIVRMLAREGVDTVFGIIDGTYFGFYAMLKKHGIKLVTPRHETIALHMAGTYARMTGKLGVCMASNGPGVANALSGVAVENAEGNRVLFITSTRRQNIGYPDRGGSYQYFDQVGVIGKMAKYSGFAPNVGRVAEITRQALRHSFTGRPGVCHVDVPEDVMNGKFEVDESIFVEPYQYRRTEPIAPPASQVELAAKMLVAAELPVLHFGYGVHHAAAYDEARRVAEALCAPVTTSWAGRGVLDERHELAIPMIYIEAVNLARNMGDVALAVGSRIGETDWWGKAPYWRKNQKMIQVDVDDEVLGRNKPTDLAIIGDAKVFLGMLADRLESMKSKINRKAREEAVAKLKGEIANQRGMMDAAIAERDVPVSAAHAAVICREFFQDDAVAVFDGGNTAVWANLFHEVRVPNTHSMTYKMGHLGAGVGQALGAAAARPDAPVYCIIGDGAMGFHPQEVETAIRNDLKVIYLVCCDRQWGMVKMTQQMQMKPLKTIVKRSLSADETINTDLGEIDFNLMARAMGAHGERVGVASELPAALKRCVAADKCSVIHLDVDPVKHMWAPGLIYFKKMHQEPEG